MRVFLSWSGPRSLAVAETLNYWLPEVLQGVTCFLSAKMDAGVRWPDAIASELDSLRFGVLCLTEESLPSTWMGTKPERFRR